MSAGARRIHHSTEEGLSRFAWFRASLYTFLLSSVAIGAVACERDGGAESRGPVRRLGGRAFLAAQWDTLWVVESSLQDTLLQRPVTLAATDDGVYVLDPGGHRVLAFDLEGKLRWTYGRKGGGPDEFNFPISLEAQGGEVYILDRGNARVTVLDRDGKVVRRTPIREESRVDGIVPLDGGRLVLVTSDAERPIVVVDPDGKPLSRSAMPWEGFASLHDIVRQGRVANDGGAWAFAFSSGDGWVAFSGTEPTGVTGRFVEHVEFPEVKQEVHRSRDETALSTRLAGPPVFAAWSVSLSDSVLYVHFGGRTPLQLRIIDAYDWANGAYLGSFELPEAVSKVSVRGDRFYLLRTSPLPAILALRLANVPDALRSGQSIASGS